MYVYIYIHINTQTQIKIYVCIYMCIYMLDLWSYIYKHVYIHSYILHVYIYSYIFHVYLYSYIFVCMCVYMCCCIWEAAGELVDGGLCRIYITLSLTTHNERDLWTCWRAARHIYITLYTLMDLFTLVIYMKGPVVYVWLASSQTYIHYSIYITLYTLLYIQYSIYNTLYKLLYINYST
jgi:hypothetical protein